MNTISGFYPFCSFGERETGAKFAVKSNTFFPALAMAYFENVGASCVGKFMCVVPPKVRLGTVVCPLRGLQIEDYTATTDVTS